MEIIVSDNAEDVIYKMANMIVFLAEKTLRTKPLFTFCLSGGNTPRKLFSLLASKKYKDKIDWQRVQFFLGDERFVPRTDDRSNARMIEESLLSQINISPSQVHFFNTELPIEDAIEAYDAMLHSQFSVGSPSFDLCLLGMGADAHTLSIFPMIDTTAFANKWVVQTFETKESLNRITLTPLLVNQSTYIAFLVTGTDKASAVKQVIDDPYDPIRFPAQLINPTSNKLFYFLDEDAAAFLDIDSENFLDEAFD